MTIWSMIAAYRLGVSMPDSGVLRKIVDGADAKGWKHGRLFSAGQDLSSARAALAITLDGI